jgi:hypothetical protein
MAIRRRAKSKSKQKAARKAKPQPPGVLPLVDGYWIAQLVYVAAQLDLADVLAKGRRKRWRSGSAPIRGRCIACCARWPAWAYSARTRRVASA